MTADAKSGSKAAKASLQRMKKQFAAAAKRFAAAMSDVKKSEADVSQKHANRKPARPRSRKTTRPHLKFHGETIACHSEVPAALQKESMQTPFDNSNALVLVAPATSTGESEQLQRLGLEAALQRVEAQADAVVSMSDQVLAASVSREDVKRILEEVFCAEFGKYQAHQNLPFAGADPDEVASAASGFMPASDSSEPSSKRRRSETGDSP